MKKMSCKKSRIETKKHLAMLLAILSILALLTGCVEKNQKTEVPDSDDWRDMQVIMHGVRLKDVENMTLDDLLDLGFKKDLKASLLFYPRRLEAGDKINYFFRPKDGSKEVYNVFVRNFSDEKKSTDKCNISGISILEPEESNGSKDAIVSATDVYLANGVGLGMKSDEVRTIMGAPTNEYDPNNDMFSKVYVYKVDGKSNRKSDSVTIAFGEDDTVKYIGLIYWPK